MYLNDNILIFSFKYISLALLRENLEKINLIFSIRKKNVFFVSKEGIEELNKIILEIKTPFIVADRLPCMEQVLCNRNRNTYQWDYIDANIF